MSEPCRPAICILQSATIKNAALQRYAGCPSNDVLLSERPSTFEYILSRLKIKAKIFKNSKISALLDDALYDICNIRIVLTKQITSNIYIYRSSKGR